MGFKAGRAIREVGIFCLKISAICTVLFSSNVQRVQARQQAATIRQIAVTGDDRGVGVEITANRPVTPRMQTVTDPDRLIVDLPEARPDAALQKVAINRGKLRNVRVGLLSANPPVTRVVMDLAAPTDYRVSPLANTIVVTLGEESSPEPTPTFATANPPALTRPAETTPAVAITAPEPPTQRSWAHWIMPILVTTSVLAMLLISLIVHIQNRRHRRGI